MVVLVCFKSYANQNVDDDGYELALPMVDGQLGDADSLPQITVDLGVKKPVKVTSYRFCGPLHPGTMYL